MSDTPSPLAVRNLLSGLTRAPLRFPVPLACGVGWATATITREHGIGGLEWSDVERLQVMFISGFFVSLAATLFTEGRGWNWLLRQGVAVATLALAAFATSTAGGRDAYDSPAFYLLAPGGALLMTVAPFLHRGADGGAVWTFNLCSWVSALFGLIVAVGLGVGGTVFLVGLEILFGVDITGDAYGDVWIVCMSVVWPWQTLAGVPGGFEAQPDEQAPRWASYLITWLLVPLALLYLGMLVAFALMILVQWSLPRGTIGWMVAVFAAYGVAVWSAAHPLHDAGNVVIRQYYRYFHFALFVPVLLLAVGVGARVTEYGVTEKRYALLVLTVWLAGIALYGVLKRPAHLTVAPVTLGAMLVLGAFGPWGASSVSLRSQLGQLEALLADAGILVEGRIEPDQGLADPQQVQRISGIVRYMRKTGKLDDLEAWMAAAGSRPGAGADNDTLLARLGLDYVEAWEEGNEFHVSIGEYMTLDVAEFDMAYRIRILPDLKDLDLPPVGGGPNYRARFDGRILHVWPADRPGVRLAFDLDHLAETVRPLDLRDGDPQSMAAMTLETADGGLRARLHVESMTGHNSATGNDIDYGRAVLLVGRAE